MNAIITDEMYWNAHKTNKNDRRIAKDFMKALRSKDYDYPEAKIEIQKEIRYRLGFQLPEECLFLVKSYLLLPRKDFDICYKFSHLPKLEMVRFIENRIRFNWNDTISQYDPNVPENLTNPIQVVPIRTYTRNNLVKIFIDKYIRDTSDDVWINGDYNMRDVNFSHIQTEYDKSLHCSGDYTLILEQKLCEIHTRVIHSALCDLWGTEKCIVRDFSGTYWGNKSNHYYAVTQKKADGAVSRLLSNGAYKRLLDDLNHQFWSKFDAEVSKTFYEELRFYRGSLNHPYRAEDSMRSLRSIYREIRCFDKKDTRSIVELEKSSCNSIVSQVLNTLRYTLTPDTLRDALDNWKPAINAERIDAFGRKIKNVKKIE